MKFLKTVFLLTISILALPLKAAPEGRRLGPNDERKDRHRPNGWEND